MSRRRWNPHTPCFITLFRMLEYIRTSTPPPPCSPGFPGLGSIAGQFQSSVREATHSQEQLNQVRHLAWAFSRTAQTTSCSQVSQQSQKRKNIPPPPPAVQTASSGDGGSAGKHQWSETGATKGPVGSLLSLRGSRVSGGRGSLKRDLQLVAIAGSPPLSPPIPPIGGWVGVDESAFLDILGLVWDSRLTLA